MRGISRASVLAMGLVGAACFGAIVIAQCAKNTAYYDAYGAYTGGHVYYQAMSSDAQSLATQAKSMWSSPCASQFSSHFIPSLEVSSSPPNPGPGESVYEVWYLGSSPTLGVCGTWNPPQGGQPGQIKVYSTFREHAGEQPQPCLLVPEKLAHELGHSLGLGDVPWGSCPGYMMGTGGPVGAHRSTQTRECNKANTNNRTPQEQTPIPVGTPGGHPCDVTS